MVYTDGRLAISLADAAGRRLLNVIERADGTARFIEINVASDIFYGDYWYTNHRSGFFRSTGEALSEARNMLPWMAEDGLRALDEKGVEVAT